MFGGGEEVAEGAVVVLDPLAGGGSGDGDVGVGEAAVEPGEAGGEAFEVGVVVADGEVEPTVEEGGEGVVLAGALLFDHLAGCVEDLVDGVAEGLFGEGEEVVVGEDLAVEVEAERPD